MKHSFKVALYFVVPVVVIVGFFMWMDYQSRDYDAIYRATIGAQNR